MGVNVSDLGLGRVLEPGGWRVQMWVGQKNTPEHEPVDLGALLDSSGAKGPGWLRFLQLGIAARNSQAQFRAVMTTAEAALYDASSAQRQAGWFKAAKDADALGWMP